MSLISNEALIGAAGSGVSAYQIEQSLRFDGSSWLQRTFGNDGSSRPWTYSGWVKKSSPNDRSQPLIAVGNSSGSQNSFFGNPQSWNIQNSIIPGGGLGGNTVWAGAARDYSAWYHWVLQKRSSTANDWRLYVNGVQFTTTNNTTSWNNFNRNIIHYIGRDNYDPGFLGGYLAELHFVDNQILDPTNFGEFDDNGVWRPIEVSGLTYGTNGFYLTFDPSATNGVGHDHSGNGNNFTATGFTTSGTGTDVMDDTPTKNWCTLNLAANSPGTRTLSNGNLQADLSGSGAKGVGTFLIPTSGKWYWEMTCNDSNGNQAPGVLQHDSNFGTYDTSKAASYFPNGEYRIESASQVSGFSTYTTNDVIAFAVDADTSPPEIYFAKNNTWQNSADPAAGTNGFDLTADQRYLPYLQHGSSGSSSSGIFNFGQRAFAYTPPTGYKALNTKNLPAPSIKDGSDYFNTIIYQGASPSDKAVTGVGFQPDFTWIKARTQAYSHALYDAVRGATKELHSDTDELEDTDTNGLKSFDSDGFTVGSDGEVGDPTGTRVAWNWKANGSGSSNTDGTITSTVSANATAGFSIISFTGTGSAASIGHGLGVKPGLVIGKDRDRAVEWKIYFPILGNYVEFTTAAQSGVSNAFTGATSSVLNLQGSGYGLNYSGDKSIVYCFAEVEGYSKFGSYTGNASTDGPFVYCGFKPAWIMYKNVSASGTVWIIFDTARNTYNFADAQLRPNENSAENSAGTSYSFDLLSNGFKVRSSDSNLNGSGNTMVYAAFAENPFGGIRTSPATAR